VLSVDSVVKSRLVGRFLLGLRGGSEGYSNDESLNFEDFEFVIHIYSSGDEAVARRLFERLAASNRFPMLMTEEMDRELARHWPTAAST